MSRILVIDDERLICNLVHAVLASEGYEVELAPDGLAGLEAFENHPPDLVLCDLSMPGMSGEQTIRELVRRHPGAVVIALSGGSLGEVETAARECGASAMLLKPFHVDELVAIVDMVVNCSRPATP